MGGSTMSSNDDLLAKVVDPSLFPDTEEGRAAKTALATAIGEATAHLSDVNKKIQFGKSVLSVLRIVLGV